METYTTTSTWPWAGMSNGIISFAFRFRCLSFLQVLSVGLESGHDVQLWRPFTRPSTDCPTIHHKSRAVETPNYSKSAKHLAEIKGARTRKTDGPSEHQAYFYRSRERRPSRRDDVPRQRSLLDLQSSLGIEGSRTCRAFPC
jgi:hypothetical protein